MIDSNKIVNGCLQSPARLLTALAVTSAISEAIIMIILSLLPPMPDLLKGFIDSMLLLITILPAIYFLAFRPMIYQIRERQRADEALRQSYDELEQRVQERTASLAMAQEDLRRRYDAEAVINTLLSVALKDIPLEKVLQEAIDSILAIPWLSIESKGCIFLIEGSPPCLVMRAQRNLGNDLLNSCANVSFGKCLCGRAALSHKNLFCPKVDERHDIRPKDMTPHGHYCIPILIDHKLLGLINVYVSEGHRYAQEEEAFLSSVANALAGIILRRNAEKERANIEQQLHQAQKLQAIGTLAGGIAHDFNNLLYPIIGYAEMLAEDAPTDSQQRKNLESIIKAASRAKDLIRQISAFSRQDSSERGPIQIGPVVKETLALLKATLPSSIEIREQISNNCCAVSAEPTKIQQIVMNLCTNSAHAMRTRGGSISVSLTRVDPNSPLFPANSHLSPGTYAMLEVSDTGHGMEPEIVKRIFDPFFTTKAPGEGSGMGLSVVDGIVGTYDGHISVQSDVNKGTTMRVYLPSADKVTSSDANTSVPPAQIPHGQEHVLVVDDEAAIVQMLRQMLERLGYHVTALMDSLEAIKTFRAQPEKFALVISDLTMPQMGGTELALELRKIKPDIAIILCTGYGDDVSEDNLHGLGINRMLTKPILLEQLAKTVRDVLDKIN